MKLPMAKATTYDGNRTFSIAVVEEAFPPPQHVRISVQYCGICGTDIHIFHGMMDQRIKMPMTLGHEMSGTIDAVGDGVTDLKVGDKVVVRPLDNRGERESDKGFGHICQDLKFIGIDSPGAMQQKWVVPAFTIHKIPPDIDMKLAALVEPLAVACHDVKRSRLQPGEQVLVLGGGPIGLLIALVARHHGANVYLAEVNATRIALASELGFETINPSEQDIAKTLEERTNRHGIDVVFEVAGVQSTVDLMTKVAGIRGRIVMVAIHGKPRNIDLFQFFWKELELIGARVYEEDDYEEAIGFVSSDQLPLDKLITAVLPIGQIQDAFEEIDRNPAGMKVLLDCQAWN